MGKLRLGAEPDLLELTQLDDCRASTGHVCGGQGIRRGLAWTVGVTAPRECSSNGWEALWTGSLGKTVSMEAEREVPQGVGVAEGGGGSASAPRRHHTQLELHFQFLVCTSEQKHLCPSPRLRL